MFYCGIDIAKYKHEATVIDQAGAALLESISFANSKEGCEKLLALFQPPLHAGEPCRHAQLPLQLKELMGGTAEQVMHRLAADARLLGDFPQGKVLFAVHAHHVPLLGGEQPAIKGAEPIQLDFLFQLALGHGALLFRCKGFPLDTQIIIHALGCLSRGFPPV